MNKRDIPGFTLTSRDKVAILKAQGIKQDQTTDLNSKTRRKPMLRFMFGLFLFFELYDRFRRERQTDPGGLFCTVFYGLYNGARITIIGSCLFITFAVWEGASDAGIFAAITTAVVTLVLLAFPLRLYPKRKRPSQVHTEPQKAEPIVATVVEIEPKPAEKPLFRFVVGKLVAGGKYRKEKTFITSDGAKHYVFHNRLKSSIEASFRTIVTKTLIVDGHPETQVIGSWDN